MRNLLIIGWCLILAGCAHGPDLIVKPFTQPQYGMTKQQMFDLIGKPDSVEVYKETDLTMVEFYMYHKGYGSSQEKVPVCLIDNKVVGWGKAFYEDHVRADDIRMK